MTKVSKGFKEKCLLKQNRKKFDLAMIPYALPRLSKLNDTNPTAIPFTDLDLPQRFLRQDPPSIHLPIRKLTALTIRRNALTMGHTAKAKVRLTTKTTENISNVVLCSDAIFECGIPIFNNAFGDLNACVEDICDGD
jgi:hypothetical protein